MDVKVTMIRRHPLALSPELTVQDERQGHLQMGSSQSDWAVRGDALGTFPVSFTH